MFIVALFVRAPNWKQPTGLAIGEWLKKEKTCATMEYCSVMKSDGLPEFPLWLSGNEYDQEP